jgi:putative membrane protein insertion efficiency factor
MKQNAISWNIQVPEMKKAFQVLHEVIIWLMILPIKFYKYSISPLLPNSCRHVPTCSEYAMQSLKVHGVFRGSLLAIWRILRCNPWGTHGYDPVPPARERTNGV